MDGFFLLNKERGVTSSNLVQSVRRKLRLPKLGHTGTLDSFAEGLMILPSGRACSFASIFLEMNKTYEASLELGKSTDSGDPEGDTLEEWSEASVSRFWNEDLENGKRLEEKILSTLQWTSQEAPLVSALKKGGKRMSDLFRSGKETEKRLRPITVESVQILSMEPKDVRFRIRVSSGTYIRKIAIDIGQILGIPTSLNRLIRTSIGNVDWNHAKILSEIQIQDARSIQDLLGFPSYCIEEKYIPWVETGRKPPIPSEFIESLQEQGVWNFFLVSGSGRILSWASIEKKLPDWKFNRVFA